ncbi:hypothetical protein D6D18_06926 [Aureobasidium pullulans]|nr:hypothetical protein D6D18_06926 [Aureobasidium pullulans]
MDDKKGKGSYMAHACDLAIKFPECDLPDWFPSSTGQPTNEYYNACTPQESGTRRIQHRTLQSGTQLSLSSGDSTNQTSERFKHGVPPDCVLLSRSKDDRSRNQDSIFIALAQHPCIEDIALTDTLDLDIVTSALAKPKPFTSLRSLNIGIRIAAVTAAQHEPIVPYRKKGVPCRACVVRTPRRQRADQIDQGEVS